MAGAPSLPEARRWFAEELRACGHVGDQRVVEAFATVPRERFVGPGPWRIFHIADGYWSTPDADPRHLYHNVLVALDEATAGLRTVPLDSSVLQTGRDLGLCFGDEAEGVFHPSFPPAAVAS